MRTKYRYAAKYIGFRLIPFFVYLGAVSAMLLFLGGVNQSPAEQAAAILLCALAAAIFVGYSLFRILPFLRMIRRQEEQYGVIFDDKNPKTVEKWSSWIVLTDHWLILPGRLALYREEIRSASIGDARPQKGGTVYPVNIQTASGKTFRLKCKSEASARFVRKWARR